MAQITRALERYEKNNKMAVTLVLEHLSVYVSLLHRHIHMEDRRFGDSDKCHEKHQAPAGKLSDILTSW